MNYHQRKYLPSSVLALTAFGALLLCNPSPGLAVAILGDQLATFAVLGASTVTNTGDHSHRRCGCQPRFVDLWLATITVNGRMERMEATLCTLR